MGLGGLPGKKGLVGVQWAHSTEKWGVKASLPKISRSQRSIKCLGSLPSALSGRPTIQTLFLLMWFSKSFICRLFASASCLAVWESCSSASILSSKSLMRPSVAVVLSQIFLRSCLIKATSSDRLPGWVFNLSIEAVHLLTAFRISQSVGCACSEGFSSTLFWDCSSWSVKMAAAPHGCPSSSFFIRSAITSSEPEGWAHGSCSFCA